jgi:hypothetical protein
MIYLRHNGGMWFWRIGRVGGSFYISSVSRVDDETRSIERAIARLKRARVRKAAALWHRYGCISSAA